MDAPPGPETTVKRIAILLVLMLGTALLATNGCSKRYRIQVESDTCWDGLIDEGETIFDCGNSSYKVIGQLRCVRLQKKTDAGYLRVRIDSGPWASTTAPLGIVQVCR
jgi:hypothetical protein